MQEQDNNMKQAEMPPETPQAEAPQAADLAAHGEAAKTTPTPAADVAEELRAEIAKQRAELEQIQKETPPETPAPESEEIASLREESARLRSELDDLRGSVAKSESTNRKQARSDAFARLGVLEEYHEVIPDSIDPRTADGARALETWLAKRPLLTRSRAPVPPEIDVEGYAPSVQQVIKGERANPLISKESLRAMQRHANEHRR